jgi:RNA polymerase-binding transcription factor DksA/very-short-patch-repair endonuclease/DNA polymerase III delta prime subunit
VTTRDVRERTKRLFQFLKEYAALRFPLVRDLNDRKIRWKLPLDALPEHPSISISRPAAEHWEAEGGGGSEQENGQAVLIRVQRPSRSEPPDPPSSLRDWIHGSWKDPSQEPTFHAERKIPEPDGNTHIERFTDDANRHRQWTQWLECWRAWAQKERPARRAWDVYEKLHELHGELQREEERYELILADGIVFWRWQAGYVYFPLILMPVQLTFDHTVPEFTIVETGKNPELYTALLQEAPLPNSDVLRSLREEIISSNRIIHPLEDADTTAYLREVAHALSVDGEFLPEPVEPKGSALHPLRIWRKPMLLLLPRTQGYSRSIDRVLEALERCEALPATLAAIVGGTLPSPRAVSGTDGTSPGDDPAVLESVFFTKEWNPEQLQIAARLDRFGNVLVQGPPGTGKTHTIANLIGHLLAQGKSVLVTAHTSKALRVLRDDHIPEALRPLAISVLDDELASRRQLDEAAQAITDRLSRDDASRLHKEAARLEQRRRQLLCEVADVRRQLIEAIGGEYRAIVLGGQEYHPSEAARLVAEGTGRDDWIPGPVEPGAPLPLSQEELAELYRLNRELPQEDERELLASLPEPEKLPSPEEFESLVALITQVVQGHHPEWWARGHTVSDVPALEDAAKKARELGERLQRAEPWELMLIGNNASLFTTELFDPAEALRQLVMETTSLCIAHDPMLPDDGTWEEHEQIAEQLAALAEHRGGQLTSWDTSIAGLLNRRRKQFLASARVATGRPTRVEHFQALAAEAKVRKERERLRRAWTHLITQRRGPRAEDLGSQPEEAIVQQAPRLRRWLSLYQEVSDLLATLERLGLRRDHAFREPTGGDPVAFWRALGEFLSDPLPNALRAAADIVQQKEAKQRIQQAIGVLEAFAGSEIPTALREALKRPDPGRYRVAYQRLRSVWTKHVHLVRRQELLERLARVAPGWANALRMREGAHGRAELPGDPHRAWLWRQLHQELVRRVGVNVQELQHELEDRMKRLRALTQQIVEARTWAYRIEKTGPEHRHALNGWVNTMRRLGKGKGKSAPRLRREAAKLLAKAKDAVPVWIMPLARVLEHCDPATTRFDVLIVDEASQVDMLGLVLFHLGREIVVVGDHEQVSPEGVGLELAPVEQLQQEFLEGFIPNAHLYDGRRSLYDIAREFFGGSLMLSEHFRCVPEIIAFSNQLCYGGQIRPLREQNSTPLKPAVVPYRVQGTAQGKVNKEEAETIAALILAILQHPAYADKTIGVISMVGDEQARHIEQLVRKWCAREPILEQELDKRRFLCGNAAQFQGDERDVVFLSLVDSPSPDGPLPSRNDDRFKQRFNVAASRARDQLWVVYSLDPANDLKQGDLRRELIMFAEQAYRNPESVLQIPEAERAESPFEREVLEWLVHKGYRVRAQWPVGAYRIDLVVEGETGRVAIECDGDRYHYSEEQIRRDLERQAVLERLGWRLIRIRGSEFYRDREDTMRRVERELERLGVRAGDRFAAADEGGNTRRHQLVEEIIRQAKESRAEVLSRGDWRVGNVLCEADAFGSGTRPAAGRSSVRWRSIGDLPEEIMRPEPRRAQKEEAKFLQYEGGSYLFDAEGKTRSITDRENAELRDLLLAERDRLIHKLAAMGQQLRQVEELGLVGQPSEDDYGDVATEIFEREKGFALETCFQGMLRMVEDALRMQDAGTYGICERCGQPIDVERLRVLPFAPLCIRCKTEEERERQRIS